MPIILSSLRTRLEETEQAAIEKAIAQLEIQKSTVLRATVIKRSLDARKRNEITWVSSVRLELDGDEEKIARRATVRLGENRVKYHKEEALVFPKGSIRQTAPIVVVGFGPAGMFAALTLVEQGYRVIVLERGPAVEERVEAVECFWRGGEFSATANVQFGEGGAGTFSDGKLTTRISDSRCDYVLRRFVEFGAPEEILSKAKPHVGTDRLRAVVRNLRERILALGGEILFDTKLIGLKQKNGCLVGVKTDRGEIETNGLVLAIGHSARDTFAMLQASGIAMEAKPFSVGVRAEHLQSEIDRGLYGAKAGHPALPPGEYQLSYREGERGVYTFCMCPGGVVVPSASEADTVVTNGMSEFARDGKNANAAVVVSVGPEDFGSHPMDGVRFQQELEKRAFALSGCNYTAPIQSVGRFLDGKVGCDFGRVTPSYARGISESDFTALFPPFVIDMLQKGLRQFDRKLNGYAATDTLLTGPETRTSSPVRILRNDCCESVSCDALYPCGEGAGYAGGIMSAAVDGIRVAQEIMKKYMPSES